TTGANEFFYLQPTGKPASPGCLHVRNGAGWEGEIEEECLKPVIKSLREVKSIFVDASLLGKVFLCTGPLKKYPKAAEYVKWGQSQKYHLSVTCQQRQKQGTPWWNLGEHPLPDGFYSILNGERHLIPMNANAYTLDNLGEIFCKKGVDKYVLFSILNSTFFKLLIELTGRTMTGSITAVKVQVFEFEDIQLPSMLLSIDPSEAMKALMGAAKEEIGSILEELGVTMNSTTSFELIKVKTSRARIDDLIFSALGLTTSEREAVYEAVVELVSARLRKAESVKGGKRS
ncbi:MAG: hypothetical protein NZ933_09210, partial [Bacteroidia bacterium]|nr:hypothetical protein [Bacteroidia bacterium]